MTTCRRCGTCCSKGGPALHLKDRQLVESGAIPLSALFTIRRHEPAYDNVASRIAPAQTDIIKIKPRSGQQRACQFYEPNPPRCSIYAQRPLECRLLQCWNTRPLEAVYQHDRLTRRHLLAGHSAVWELIVEHEAHCGCKQMARLAEQLKQERPDRSAGDTLLAMLRYDHSLRETLKERTGLAPDLYDVFFGRPLAVTLRLFSLKLTRTGTPGHYGIAPI